MLPQVAVTGWGHAGVWQLKTELLDIDGLE